MATPVAPEQAAPPPAPAEGSGHLFSRADVLRWLYLGRLTLVTGILVGALLREDLDAPLRVSTVMFLVALAVTSVSFWYTHLMERDPGENFLYAQVVLDVLLVTGIVHITGGPESNFAPLYILVISSGALLLPLSGGVLIGALASMVYFADLVWGYQGQFRLEVALQIGLFAVVALITGVLGDRLRRAGTALGAVESELRQLRLDTGDILANLATGVLTVDGEGRLAYANPAAAELLGLPLESLMGRPALEELERAAPGMGRVLERSVSGGEPVDRFRTQVSGDRGELVRLGVSTAVLERSGETRPSATAIFQDITDLERLEALNRRTERLEAVAELSASLAHEIKNPLASIRSAVEQLTKSPLVEADRSVLERLVLTESDRLSRLLSEFLDYSGLRLGAREEVDLRAVVRDCVALIRQHPEARGVDISCAGHDEPVLVAGDQDLLHRAMLNLLLNAVHFGDSVELELKDLAGKPYPRGTEIRHAARLVVADDGPGIAPEVMERLFDPFFTTREGGSGLGLAVVHRAVEAHSGAIFAERAPTGGAKFVIFLPVVGGSQGGEKA